MSSIFLRVFFLGSVVNGVVQEALLRKNVLGNTCDILCTHILVRGFFLILSRKLAFAHLEKMVRVF